MKYIISVLVVNLVFSSCYSVKKSIQKSLPLSQEIIWPEDFKPEDSKFFVHNEINIAAPPELVWNILIQASKWESYYEGASDLVIINNQTGRLDKNSIFRWKTMGLAFTSRIKEFEAPSRLSWESNKKSIRGYHAWLILPTDSGSKLITSEAQFGFMTFMQKVFVPRKLEGLHEIWLAKIKEKAETQKITIK